MRWKRKLGSRFVSWNRRYLVAQLQKESDRWLIQRAKCLCCNRLKQATCLCQKIVFGCLLTSHLFSCCTTWASRRAHIRVRYRMCANVTSQVKGLPRCHGISVKPSGRLPSCLANPTAARGLLSDWDPSGYKCPCDDVVQSLMSGDSARRPFATKPCVPQASTYYYYYFKKLRFKWHHH